MDYPEFIARVTSHIPDRGQVMVITASTPTPIINHLKLTFTAAKSPPARIASQELLTAAEAGEEYFS